MNNIKIKSYSIKYFGIPSILLSAIILFSACFFLSCDKNILPEEGSIADLTPPSPAFTFKQDEANYLNISFVNQSISATDFAWDFGDGTSSTDKSPTHIYSAEGKYIVALTASDKLGVSNTITKELEIVEPEVEFTPVILNPGFDIEGADAYRDGWRNADLGGVIQITSSPVHTAPKAAKFPAAGDRIAYQLIEVQKNKKYVVSFYYTLLATPEGSISVSILGGEVTDPTKVEAATIAKFTGTDQTDPSTYLLGSVEFNSGSNNYIAIFVTNAGAEARIDSFTIAEQ